MNTFEEFMVQQSRRPLTQLALLGFGGVCLCAFLVFLFFFRIFHRRVTAGGVSSSDAHFHTHTHTPKEMAED